MRGMIFVTVGTHEQQFNRLIKEMDRLKGENIVKEEVFMQIGFSTYEPKYCRWDKMISYKEMQENIKNAHIVITHGGPASFIAPLQIGKIPIVVPRQKQFGEHVNDHQLEFCRAVKKQMGNIIVIESIGQLSEAVIQYDDFSDSENNPKGKLKTNNDSFNRELEKIVEMLFKNVTG